MLYLIWLEYFGDDLGGEPQHIECTLTGNFYAPVELSGEGSGDLIDIGAECLFEKFTVFGVVVNATGDTAYLALLDKLGEKVVCL